MDRKGYSKLNMSVLQNKKSKTVSSAEALRDVVPFNWSEQVLTGKQKIKVTACDEKKN